MTFWSRKSEVRLKIIQAMTKSKLFNMLNYSMTRLAETEFMAATLKVVLIRRAFVFNADSLIMIL